MQSSPLQETLNALYRRFKGLNAGTVATYIPELGRANPDQFGICIATVDGHIYRAGDFDHRFTIQSISKPFVYGLALDDLGVDAVAEKVGVEPSGEAFNAISLEPVTGRPRNPMINAGAIATTSLVHGANRENRLHRVLEMLGTYADTQLTVDGSVFESERETGHRNRAIGHLLRNAGVIEGDVDTVVDLYFAQCSVLVSCENLAVMAATLANGGLNPVSGARAVQPGHVERLLSVMSTCGMYDYAGSWAYRVGMPAKSGVAGGVIAVLPGQFGIGVFSPRLDEFGNSVRGVAVCEALSREFGLHLLRPPVSPGAVVRTTYSLADVSSKRQRAPAETAFLAAHGEAVRIVELQGPLVLSTIDIALRRGLEQLAPETTLVLDCRRVAAAEDSAIRLLGQFATDAFTAGSRLCLVQLAGNSSAMSEHILRLAEAGVLSLFGSMDSALEACEDALLHRAGLVPDPADELAFAQHPTLTGLTQPEIDALRSVAERQVYPPGSRIVSEGEPASALYLLVRGHVSVSVDLANGERGYRLATLDAGVSFGEAALVDDRLRSANVDAESEVVCYRITSAAINALSADYPHVRVNFLENMARDLALRLGRANREIRALAS